MAVQTVALLTAGGLAPCLSSAVGGLIERYTSIAPDVRIIAYQNGYAGLLTGRSVEVTPEVREGAALLHRFGGSPIGNSRVKAHQRRGLRQARPRQGGAGPAPRGGRAGSPPTASTCSTPSAATTRTPRQPTSRHTCVRTTTRSRSSACPRRSTTTSSRSASRWVRGPQPSRARCSPATCSPSTRPTRACSSSTRSWDGTAAGSRPRRPVGTTRGWGSRSGFRASVWTSAAGTCTPSSSPSRTSTSRVRALGSRPSWTRSAASTSSCQRVRG